MNKAVQMVISAQNVEKDSPLQQICVCTANITLGNFPITVVSVERDSRGKGTIMNICANTRVEVMPVNTAQGCSKVLKVYGTIYRNILESSDSVVMSVASNTIFMVNI